ncbi:unnamed protein product [Symbiodinium sp. CCMP2592]|nr:unnamed protein product [Symbiodinium sp. CCMP2592]
MWRLFAIAVALLVTLLPLWPSQRHFALLSCKQNDCFGHGEKHPEHRGTNSFLPVAVPSDSSQQQIITNSIVAFGMPKTTTGSIRTSTTSPDSRKTTTGSIRTSTTSPDSPQTTTGSIRTSTTSPDSPKTTTGSIRTSTTSPDSPQTTTGSIRTSTTSPDSPKTTTGSIRTSTTSPDSPKTTTGSIRTSTTSPDSPQTTTGSIRTSTTSPDSPQQEDARTCKHDLSGRLYRKARNFQDDYVATAGLMLVDAFVHPSKHFAYVLFSRQRGDANGPGFVTGQEQLRFARHVSFNCYWVSPENPSQLLHMASDSSWQNRTYKGQKDDLYQLITAKCDAGNVAAGMLQEPLLMNITATAEGKILARWENVMVCHEPLSPTPVRSIVCTAALREGRNPHSGAVYEPKSMDPYIKNWVEYSLGIGFDMVLMYFEDQDLSPMEDMLRPYIDSHKVVLVRSYFHGITGHGWSPLLYLQENHCLWRSKGLARYVAHNDVDEWVDLNANFSSINDYMHERLGNSNYAAVSIPERRWKVPGLHGSRGGYDFDIYPCDEICMTGPSDRNKLLMHTERVNEYNVHWIRVPPQDSSSTLTPPPSEIRLVHFRLVHLLKPENILVCPEGFVGPQFNSSFATFVKERCPSILPQLPNYTELPPFWRRRRAPRPVVENAMEQISSVMAQLQGLKNQLKGLQDPNPKILQAPGGECLEVPSSQAGPESLPPGLPQAQAARTVQAGNESHLAVPKTPPEGAPQDPPPLPSPQKKAAPLGAKPLWLQQQQPGTTVPAAPLQQHAAPDLAGGAPPPPPADASPKRKAPPLGIDATTVAPCTAPAPAPAPIARKAPPGAAPPGAESLYKAPPSMHKAPPSGASEWPPRESSRPPAPPLPTQDVPPTSKPSPPQFKAPPSQSMAQPPPALTSAQTSSPQAKPVPKKAPPVYTPAPVIPKPPPNDQIPSKAPPASARLREPGAGPPQAPAPCKTKAPPAAVQQGPRAVAGDYYLLASRVQQEVVEVDSS